MKIYLFIGPAGSGKTSAARKFTTNIITPSHVKANTYFDGNGFLVIDDVAYHHATLLMVFAKMNREKDNTLVVITQDMKVVEYFRNQEYRVNSLEKVIQFPTSTEVSL